MRNSDISDLPLRLEDFLSERAALIMWDMQKGLAGRAFDADRIAANASKLLAAADAMGRPVIWSRHVLPPLELTTGPFLLFLMKKQRVDHPSKLQPSMQEGGKDTEFLQGLKPAQHHIVLEKSQPSLFIDTPLALRLRAMNVRTLVLCGVATDIGIEFTARHAAALGFYSIIVEDATGSYTKDAHDRSIAFLRSWITPVVTTSEVCQIWAEWHQEESATAHRQP